LRHIRGASKSRIASLRWRIERDYQELKQEVGLGHFESRGWRGFHHHATMCIATSGFLISERETIPPSGAWRRPTSCAAVEKWRATLTGRPFPNVYRRQRKADGFLGTGWNPIGEMLGFHGVLFQTP
jgi:Transposase DDE domain